MANDDARRAVEAVWRIEGPRIIAGLARYVRDVGLGEELAQDALVAALEQWPRDGVPVNPGAWLMAVGKRRATDRLRHLAMAERKLGELARTNDATSQPEIDAVHDEVDGDIQDDLLRLVFTACHPVLSTEARVALTLRMLGGLTTDEIARAFLVPESTIAQRIVRAKRRLARDDVPFETPSGATLADRLQSVLEVVYLIFNEGYAASAGDRWTRPELCAEAMRLGRVLAGLLPDEPEVLGLVALMELQASRLRARLGPSGEPVLLDEQDRTRWDQLLTNRGLAALAEAETRLADRGEPPGPYVLQASIAACHARALSVDTTDWIKVSALYTALALRTPSPVVELNRAVALGRAFGPETGLAIVDELVADGALDNYSLLWSARADLLERSGRPAEAEVALDRAILLTRNDQERTLLEARLAALSRRS